MEAGSIAPGGDGPTGGKPAHTPALTGIPGWPPVLLSMAHWYGTLAAVRELGRRGIEVHVASGEPVGQAGWSRYAARRLASPNEKDAAAYIEWLLAAGRARPGAALCATSDDICFLYALHERELGAHFLLSTPGLAVLRELLDKARLHLHAERVGLRTPHTLFPADAGEAEKMAAGARWPLLIKQRTQVFSRTLHKGTPIRALGELRAAYVSFRERNQFEPELLAQWPDADHAMLQEYLPQSSGHIYCLAGFVAPGGQRWATRAALKLLSHPRHLGVGLLFEHAAVRPELEERVLRLCRSVGYHGLFQCEFLEQDGDHLLIDFNPRFYNYMAFDHARGLPQAYLSYLLAIGAHDDLLKEIERVRAPTAEAERTVYAYRMGSWAQLWMERLFRRIPHDEVRRWRRWRKQAGTTIDPVWSKDDVRPAIADVMRFLYALARHPRDFYRKNTRKAL